MPLDYLKHLQDIQFPLEVTHRGALQLTSKLAAVGFIKADLLPPFDARVPRYRVESALIHGITREGFAELARLNASAHEAMITQGFWLGANPA